jgi:hypothetical protein
MLNIGSTSMATVLFHCPNTGFRVQAYLPEQASDDENSYVPVDCLVCKQVHLVNLGGEVLGEVLELRRRA